MNSNRMLPLVILLSAGCAGSGPSLVTPSAPAPTPASSKQEAPGSAKASGFPETPEEQAKTAEKKRQVEEMARQLTDREAKEKAGAASLGEGEIVTDPVTGERQQRIEKSKVYRASGGRLFLGYLGDQFGFPILREDDKAWYVPAPKYRGSTVAQEESKAALGGATLRPLPEEEAEIAVPKRTSEKLRLEEISEGLPTGGMWRENFSFGDLEGNGRLEIVSPPPRLSGEELMIFRLEGDRWVKPPVTFEDPERIGFEYGGTACADMDGDGKVDIVFGYHGSGPAVAYNKGNYHFVVTAQGMPRPMSTRALAVGDLDGDGHLDVVAVSDMPEYTLVSRAEAQGNFSARLAREGGYLPGFDARAFLWRNGKFEENHAGLGEACYAYGLALAASPSDHGMPFFATGCQYYGNPTVVYQYDKDGSKFVPMQWEAGERFGLHGGAAVGTYRGNPAAFVTFTKTTPEGGTPNITSYGVTVLYRRGETWSRKRVLKVAHDPVMSQGIAVGDLNGDGLDDIVFADNIERRLRIFLQRENGEFEELAQSLEPTFVNHVSCVRIADLDRDGHPEIVFNYQPLTGDTTRAGGLRVFRVRK